MMFYVIFYHLLNIHQGALVVKSLLDGLEKASVFKDLACEFKFHIHG